MDQRKPDNSDKMWEELVAECDRLFWVAADLKRKTPDKTKEVSVAVRQWWSSVNAMLWFYVRTLAEQKRYLDPFPFDTLAKLANLAEELSNGNIPEAVNDVVHARKGRPLWRLERHAQGFAVAYIEAALRGDIDDPHPKKTVRVRYNVTAQAVRNWLKRGEELKVGVPYGHLTPERLSALMHQEGAIYFKIGRGAPSL